MKQRLMTAAGLFVLLGVVVWQVYTPVLVVVVSIFSAIASHEIMTCAKVTNKFIKIVGTVFSFCVPFFSSASVLEPIVPAEVWYNVIYAIDHKVYVIALVFVYLLAMLKGYSHTKFEHVAISVVATVFVPFGFSMFTVLRDIEGYKTQCGIYLIFFALICALGTDSGAQLGGMAFGKTKMSPNISPKKTIEGAVCGVIFSIILNAVALVIYNKVALYPLYQMGLAAEGNLLSMVIFTLIIGALFLIVYSVLSRSFIGLATANKGNAKTEYKNKEQKVKSVGGALLQKEMRHFLGSANYMLNCGLGIIFMPVAAALLFWQADTVREVLAMPFLQKYVPLLAVAAICTVATMNDMTAPSVSLEGKNIWLVQSFPILSRQVLAAKLKFHLILTVIPAISLIISIEWLIKPEIAFALLIPIVTLLFIVLMASFGLFINLKMPNLNWTNEIVPIKQSMSVMIALFGGWVIIMAFAGLYVLLDSVLSPLVYLLLVCALLLAFCVGLIGWIFTKGEKIFAAL